MTRITLKRFDVGRLADSPGVTLVLGKRATGKTTLVADLLARSELGREGGALLCAAEAGANPLRALFAPDRAHPGGYSDAVLERVMEEQRRAGADSCRVVFDDVPADRTVLTSPVFRELLRSAGDLDTGVFWTQQCLVSLPPAIRDRIDFAFVFREDLEPQRLRVYSALCKRALPTFESFCAILEGATAHRGECLVIDCGAVREGAKPVDCFFFFSTGPPK